MGDDCVLHGGMSSSRSPRPLPCLRTTQLHGDRRRQGPGEGSEGKFTAEDRRTPPPEEPGTRYYGLDDDDSVPELSGGRPDPVLDPGPPVAGLGRHTGEAFEFVLDPVVPQLGRDITDFPHVMELYFWEQLWRRGVVRDSEAAPRLAVDVPKLKGPVVQQQGEREEEEEEEEEEEGAQNFLLNLFPAGRGRGAPRQAGGQFHGGGDD